MRYLNVIPLVLLCGSAHAQIYLSLQERQTLWSELGGSQGYETLPNTYTTVTTGVGDPDQLMLLFKADIDNDSQKAKNIAANLGFGDWVFEFESGESDSEYKRPNDPDYIHNTGTFTNKYRMISLYKPNSRSDWSGIIYAEFDRPVEITVYDPNDFGYVEYVDPHVSFKFLGAYNGGRTDLVLEGFTWLNERRHFMAGKGFEGFISVGLASMQPSDHYDSKIKSRLDMTRTPGSPQVTSIGLITQGGYGWWAVKQLRGGMQIGGVIGLQYRMHYIYSLDSAAEGDKDFTSGNNILFGPFVRVSYRW